MNFPITLGITSGAAFLLGFLLLMYSRKVNSIANLSLGLFLITVGFTMIEIPLFYQKAYLQFPILFECISLIRFLTAPLLYISILYFTSFKKHLSLKLLWHFVPFLVFCAFRFPFFITGKNFELNPGLRQVVFFIFQIALPLQTLVYWILSLTRLRYHKKNIQKVSSSTTKIDLSWLQSFLFVLLLIMICWFNLVFFNLSDLTQFTPVLYLLSVFFLAYFSLQQKEIFDFNKADLQELANVIDQKKENPKRLSEERMQKLKKQLQALMDIEKLYLDNELNLPKLARHLNATSNDTSFIINDLYKDNFYNYINKYRIEEAKKLLLSKKYNQLNILGIAYESGFNSKTTFNTTFKKYTGHSPRDFVKLYKIEVIN